MDKRRAVLIANPRARSGERRALEIEKFCRLLNERGVEMEVLRTAGPGDAAQLVQQATRRGFGEIVVSGGDGTINEALQGLMGTRARLGIWPSGTANVLARELNIPFRLEGAADVIARGRASTTYVGCAINEETGERRYFFLMAGIGLDASVVRAVRPNLKKRFGKAAFWYSGLGHLAYWQPEPFEIEIEGERIPATFAAVGKAAHYGGNLSITPRARLDQPEFEICAVNSLSRLRYLYLLPRVIRGGVQKDYADIRFIRTKRARATGTAPVQVDGELIGQLPMSFEVIPDPIEIITP